MYELKIIFTNYSTRSGLWIQEKVGAEETWTNKKTIENQMQSRQS